MGLRLEIAQHFQLYFVDSEMYVLAYCCFRHFAVQWLWIMQTKKPLQICKYLVSRLLYILGIPRGNRKHCIFIFHKWNFILFFLLLL